jgi:hypothetical protein
MLTITRAEHAIDEMLIEGRSFGEIEDFIFELPVAEEVKCALWRRAWAGQPPALKRLIISAAADD